MRHWPKASLAFALLDVAQMNLADRLSAEAGVAGIALMEHAGSAVCREIQRRWPEGAVAVLCGPGNNGGDGFVVARWLARSGRPVRLALDGAISGLSGDARHHAALWSGAVEPVSAAVLDGAAVVVDAFYGSGLSRPLSEPVRSLLARARDSGLPIVAVDVPSGVRGDDGASLGAVGAELSVTFFRKKPGHLLSPGRLLCGEVVVADIGTPDGVWPSLGIATFENGPGFWASALAVNVDEAGSPRTVAAPANDCAGSAESASAWRLLPPVAEKANGDVLAYARRASRESLRMVIAQGPETVIAAPDGRAAISPGTAATLLPDAATYASRVAAGIDPFLAACAAVAEASTAAR
jgi:hydroxyethylthiazole kinase-like uncharacterized protein yjeF